MTYNSNRGNDAVLTDKEIVMDLLRRLPDDVSLYQIAQRLEFVAAVRQGLAEFDENKDSISIEQVERELTSWSVTVGRKRRGRQKRSDNQNQSSPQKQKAGDSLKPPAPSPNA